MPVSAETQSIIKSADTRESGESAHISDRVGMCMCVCVPVHRCAPALRFHCSRFNLVIEIFFRRQGRDACRCAKVFRELHEKEMFVNSNTID